MSATDAHSPHAPRPRRLWAWALLQLVTLVQTVGSGILLWNAVQEARLAPDDPLADLVMVLIMIGGIFVFSLITFLGSVRRRAWSRSAGLVLQVVWFAIGTAMLQAIIGTRGLGWGIIALVVLGIFGGVRADHPERDVDRRE